MVVPPRRLAVTAGVDIPGVARNTEMASIDDLVNAFQRTAKGMPVTRGGGQERIVATIRNEYEHVIDDRTSPAQVEEASELCASSGEDGCTDRRWRLVCSVRDSL